MKVVEVDEKQEQDDLEADYLIDEKARTATLTPRGSAKAERYFKVENISDPENAELLHHTLPRLRLLLPRMHDVSRLLYIDQNAKNRK